MRHRTSLDVQRLLPRLIAVQFHSELMLPRYDQALGLSQIKCVAID